MKPAAMKEGKLYSQQPHSGAGDFTFSRANGVQTRINEHGLIETVADNTPRLSYDLDADGNVSECPTLLLEPTSTNLLPESQNFSTNWAAVGSTIENNISSPDGGTNAYALIENTATGGKLIHDTVSVSAGQVTFSIFMKKGDKSYTSILLSGTVTTSMLNVNLENGTVSTVTGSFDSTNIEAYPSGWYRVSATLTATAGSVNANLYLMNGASYSNRNYTGNGTDKTYIFGAQFEQASYATSYIPTEGSTEVRNVDKCLNIGSGSLFNETEGTLFVDIENYDAVSRELTLSDDDPNKRIVILFYGTDSVHYRKIRFFVSNVTTQVDSSYSVSHTFNQRNKIAFTYKQDEFKAYINGTQVFSDTSGSTPSAISRLDFANYDGTTGFLEGKVYEKTVFNEALSDSELITLTT